MEICDVIVRNMGDNAYHTTWGWPAMKLHDDEKPSDRKQDGPSPRARDFLSPLQKHCKRDSIFLSRCSPPNRLCRSRSKFHGTNILKQSIFHSHTTCYHCILILKIISNISQEYSIANINFVEDTTQFIFIHKLDISSFLNLQLKLSS